MKQREKQARLKNIVTTLLVILLVTVFFKKWRGSSASDVKGEPEVRKVVSDQPQGARLSDHAQNNNGERPTHSDLKSDEKANVRKKTRGTSPETSAETAESRALTAQRTVAAEGGAAKSRLLELYPSMKGQSLFNILGKMSVSEFPAKQGTVKNEGLAEDGTTVVEYESTDGSSVTQWYSEDGSVGAETIQFSDQEKVTRWFAGSSSGVSMVQYDNGQKGGLLYLDGSGEPRTLRTWRSETDPETRIDF